MCGEYLIEGALLTHVYIIIRGIYEAYQTNKSKLLDLLHKRSHLAICLGIVAYASYDLFSFLWFLDKTMNSDGMDYTISVFNIILFNVLNLFVIDHFKQERFGEIRMTSWKELFKFG